MTIFLILIVMICLYKIKFVFSKDLYNIRYMDFDRTTSMKGLFILLVFLSHANNYFNSSSEFTSNILNKPYSVFQSFLGQGIVVMFLVYSGYGVMESIKKKGNSYINSMPARRIFKTWYHFDMAVLLYLLLGIVLGDISKWNIGKIFLSFIGWESLGNDSWYIFAILILYIITFIAFKLCKNNHRIALCVVIALSLIYIAIICQFKNPCWYNTILCYSIGMCFSIYKDKIEHIIQKKPIYYFSSLLSVFIIFLALSMINGSEFIVVFRMLFLAIMIILLTMKIDLNNKILYFFGQYLFEIYILMRIPMRIMLKMNISNIYVFVLISFVSTIILSLLFKMITNLTDKKIFKI